MEITVCDDLARRTNFTKEVADEHDPTQHLNARRQL